MASAASEADADDLPDGFKIVIGGGFGVGKTTLIAAISEIPPLSTEAQITQASLGVDDLQLTTSKTTTTVGLDFGRISMPRANLIMYLFGLPGQERFRFLWRAAAQGALGLVIMVDTRRVEDSFAIVDHFETAGVPLVIAVNQFDGADCYPLDAVRQALDLPSHVPVVSCDARDRESVRSVLITLVRYRLNRHVTGAAAATGHPTQKVRP